MKNKAKKYTPAGPVCSAAAYRLTAVQFEGGRATLQHNHSLQFPASTMVKQTNVM